MKAILFCLVLSFVCFLTRSQTNDFKLTYKFAGLGSNMGYEFYPTVKVNGTILTYTIEQNTSINRIVNRESIVDTIWNTTTIGYSINLSQDVIDTLLNLVKDTKDELIFKSNVCILSGGIHFLSLSDHSFKLSYELVNTFDSTALIICNIINRHLPEKNKIWTSPDFAKKEKDCEDLLDRKTSATKKT